MCPVTAIFAEDAVPGEWASFTPLNYDYFKNKTLKPEDSPLVP